MTSIHDIPPVMAAMQLTGHGGPEKLVYNRAVPVPDVLPGEVLVRVHACGMNNTDIKVRIAEYTVDFDPNSGDAEELTAAAASISSLDGATALTFPRIQGADIAGEIVRVGPGVAPERLGERVLVDFSIYNGRDERGRPAMDRQNVDYIGHGRDGGYAEYVTVPAFNAHPIHRALRSVELATFGCSTVTAEQMLERLRVGPGHKVLVTGAGGGVGSAAVQLARARGAIPYAVTSRGKEPALLGMGAEACVLREDFTGPDGAFHGGAFLAALAGAAGGDHQMYAVVDQVGGVMHHSLMQTLAAGGHYISAGTIAGYTPRINMHTLYMRFLSIHGSSQGTPEDFARIVRYIEQGKLQPVLGGVFRLSELPHAQEVFLEKQFVGNLVVVPDSLWDEHGSG